MKKLAAFLLISSYCLADEECYGYTDLETVLEAQLLESIAKIRLCQKQEKKECLIIADQLLHELEEPHNCLLVQTEIDEDTTFKIHS